MSLIISVSSQCAFVFRVVTVVLVLAVLNSAYAQKTDVVVLKNGDRVTAEIKELIRGEMRLSTDAFGMIYVKWEDVERIETDKRLQVEVIEGTRYFGPLDEPGETGEMAIQDSGQRATLAYDQIVYVKPIKSTQGFAGYFDSSLAVGFSYTQASDVMQWNVNASTKYRTERYLIQAGYDSLITNNGTGTDSSRRDLTASYYQYLKNRWLWFGAGGYQQNDELGVDGRFLANGGVGRVISASQKHELLIAGGLNANFENSTGSSDPTNAGSDSETSLEGLLFVEWTYFKLHTPKSNVNISFDYFPSLSESGRQRGDLKVRYRQEFVKDFFWNLSYFYNFDSDPPAGAISEEDYGVITSLEYKF